MDNTETYIKMSDCPEIQASRITLGLKYGDYYHRKDMFPTHCDLFHEQGFATNGITLGYIWLPRQDQLQEMILQKYGDPNDSDLDVHTLVQEFEGFYAQPEEWGDYPFRSMEQLWLAFVMQEKYKKIWDGDNWINGTT